MRTTFLTVKLVFRVLRLTINPTASGVMLSPWIWFLSPVMINIPGGGINVQLAESTCVKVHMKRIREI